MNTISYKITMNWSSLPEHLGFSNYEISDEGDVRNKKTKYIFKRRTPPKYIYIRVVLKHDSGKSSNQRVHRLVAHAFISNPENKLFVDHVNRNKHDNKITNLRWVTAKENNKNRNKFTLTNSFRAIYQLDMSENIVKKWNSITEAAKNIGTSTGALSAVCKGKRLSSKGFKWKYVPHEIIKGEIWKVWENIKISNHGRIKHENGRITYGSNQNGYKKVTSNKKIIQIHQLVALKFIPNLENKPYINHIDGGKTNNHISNLEWCTVKENNEHAIKTGLRKARKCGRKIVLCDKNKNPIKLYSTIKAAGKDTNIPYAYISECCTKNKLCNGLFFRYKKYDEIIKNDLNIKIPKRTTTGKRKKVQSTNISTGSQQIFQSIADAVRSLNLYSSNISKVCKGKISQTGGYKFIYMD